MLRYIYIFSAVLLIIMSAVACQPYRPSNRGIDHLKIPDRYASILSEAVPETGRWWEAFESAELNDMISRAFANNPTIEEAWARLKQMQALAVKSGAYSYPEASLEAGNGYGRQRTANGRTLTSGYEQYRLGLITSFELDLWGRIRSEQEAAALSASATRQDVSTAAMTLAASITERWLTVISQRMHKQLIEKQLAANLTLLELVELRFQNSLASALDVFQQRQIVERSRAQFPLVEQKERLSINELSALIGEYPSFRSHVGETKLPVISNPPSAGIPVQLLERRPDIQAATLRLEAADYLHAAARAARLPAVRLTAGSELESGKIALIFDNWLVNLAANLTAPLFDGGRRKAETDRTRAVIDEHLAAYRRTVITAVKEVENALVIEKTTQRYIQGLQAQLDAAQNTFNEARMRYRKGLNDYLPVLNSLLTVQDLERSILEQKTGLLINRVNLYRALGGTWAQELLQIQTKP